MNDRPFTVKRTDNHAGVTVRAASPLEAASKALHWIGDDVTQVAVRPMSPVPGDQAVYRFDRDFIPSEQP